ncbi:hypothetical protein WR30_30620 [Burkholderia contaminans FFH2055]|nr:hypothetical protein WR30_30620 [Burkholderia contaminans FFH2055]
MGGMPSIEFAVERGMNWADRAHICTTTWSRAPLVVMMKRYDAWICSRGRLEDAAFPTAIQVEGSAISSFAAPIMSSRNQLIASKRVRGVSFARAPNIRGAWQIPRE